ncbi:MAG: carbamoyltransferase C-terminal domain-containing protein [Verrucomicrobiota bacterium]
MKILGISLGHDSNMALIEDGKIKAIWEAERYFRQKRYKLSAKRLESGKYADGFQYSDVEELLFMLRRVKSQWGDSFDVIAVQNQGRLDEQANLEALLKQVSIQFEKIENVNHHLSHASLIFYTSPYSESLVLSFDGDGNDGQTVLFKATKEKIDYLENYQQRFGQSYNNLGFVIGISPDISGTGSGKTMGLAAYGNFRSEWFSAAKKYVQEYRKRKGKKVEGLNSYGKAHVINPVGLDEIKELKKYHAISAQEKGVFEKLKSLISGNKDEINTEGNSMVLPGVDHSDSHDLAKTVQKAWTEGVIEILEKHTSVSQNLCVVGGCALNGITNYEIQQKGIFKNTYFVPNPTDCGLAAGAALNLYYKYSGKTYEGSTDYYSPYLGEEIYDKEDLPKLREKYEYLDVSPNETASRVAKYISEGKIVGVIRGRYEVGPRALGNRSILSNPIDPNMREILNHKVKHREWYRPFAPVVTAEDTHRYFTNAEEIPYMSVICYTKEEYQKMLPSITHVDGSCRLQTIRRDQNEFLYDTIKAFEKITGHPVVLNTSFNPGGEPILNFAHVGLEMLDKTQMDIVLIGDILFSKKGNQKVLE